MPSPDVSPNALCFGQGLPAAGAGCRVEVSSEGLAVYFLHSPREAVGFQALRVEAGGFDLDQLVLKWTINGTDRALYLKDPAVVLAFRKAAPPALTRKVDGTAAEVRRATRSRRNVLLVGGTSALALIVAIWLGFDVLVAVAVDRIPVEWERVIGDSARDEFLTGRTIVKDGAAVSALQEVTRRLTEPIHQNPYRFEITLVRSDIVKETTTAKDEGFGVDAFRKLEEGGLKKESEKKSSGFDPPGSPPGLPRFPGSGE